MHNHLFHIKMTPVWKQRQNCIPNNYPLFVTHIQNPSLSWHHKIYLCSFSSIYLQHLSFQVIKWKSCLKAKPKPASTLFLESSLQKWKCVLTLPATEKYGQLAWIIRGIFKWGKLHKVTPSLFLIWEENTIFHLILASWAGFNDGIHLPLKIRNVFYSLTWCLLLVLSVIVCTWLFFPFF